MRSSRLYRPMSSIGSISHVHHVSKFYKEIGVVPFEHDDRPMSTVILDQRHLKSADGHKYFVPNPTLAHIVSMEFASQRDYIVMNTLPMYGITRSAVDMYHSEMLQQISIDRMCRFMRLDSVCIRDTNPLVYKIQEERLQPLIDAFYQTYGIQLVSTKGTMGYTRLDRSDREGRQTDGYPARVSLQYGTLVSPRMPGNSYPLRYACRPCDRSATEYCA